MHAFPHLVLASRSPRRAKLLQDAGFRFEVDPADESAESGEIPGESTAELVCRLARQKAANVAARYDRAIILAADTLADCGGEVLGKPRDRDDAARMLRTMSGRQHSVLTAICLWSRPDDHCQTAVVRTLLTMDELTDKQIEAYLATGAWRGKAGGFGYQDGLDWIHIIEGSESNVVGLPMQRLVEMLKEFDGNIDPAG